MNAMFARPTVEMIQTTEMTESLDEFFVVSVDLGSMSDSSAITIMSVARAYEVTCQRTKFEPVAKELKRRSVLNMTVRLIHRPRLGVSYPAIVEQVASIMGELPPLPKPPMLVLDATGLGGPVVQLARQRGLRPIGLTITAGNNATLTGNAWSAPKALLISETRIALEQRRLVVANFPGREILEREMLAFSAKLSASGRASFEAAGGEHDDTVLSVAMAVFTANHRPTPTVWTAHPRPNASWMAR